jgi:ribosomal protein S16
MYKSKVIRLRRKGAIYKPIFDIGVVNRKLKSNSQKFDKIGFIIPFGKKIFAINCLKLAKWLNYGAYLNETVRVKLAKLAVPVSRNLEFVPSKLKKVLNKNNVNIKLTSRLGEFLFSKVKYKYVFNGKVKIILKMDIWIKFRLYGLKSKTFQFKEKEIDW